jgi:cellulose biosynthesis protein BcsQ
MKGQTKYVAFSTQKGGAGKTTLTVLAASWLHYVRGYNVAVIDCDYPQHSIVEMRERDLKMALEEGYYKNLAYEQFTRLKKKAYPVIDSSTTEAIADAEHLMGQDDFDYIFFDLPGTVNDKDLIHTLARMDYIVAPISADRVVVESTLNYALMVKDHIMKSAQSDIKGLYLLWNMVDGREKTELYGVYEAVMRELGLEAMKTCIPNSLRFRREQSEVRRAVFRSTLFPVDKSLAGGSKIDALSNELVELFR